MGGQLTNGTSMTVEDRLVIVSNRLPSLRLPANEAERRTAPVGGLVTALQAALEMTGGLWFGFLACRYEVVTWDCSLWSGIGACILPQSLSVA